MLSHSISRNDSGDSLRQAARLSLRAAHRAAKRVRESLLSLEQEMAAGGAPLAMTYVLYDTGRALLVAACCTRRAKSTPVRSASTCR